MTRDAKELVHRVPRGGIEAPFARSIAQKILRSGVDTPASSAALGIDQRSRPKSHDIVAQVLNFDLPIHAPSPGSADTTANSLTEACCVPGARVGGFFLHARERQQTRRKIVPVSHRYLFVRADETNAFFDASRARGIVTIVEVGSPETRLAAALIVPPAESGNLDLSLSGRNESMAPTYSRTPGPFSHLHNLKHR